MKKDILADHSCARLATGIAAFALRCDPGLPLDRSRGNRDAVAVRRLAMYLTYTAFGMSLARCAVAFARDRSTVAHACQTVEDQREDDSFDEWVDGLENGLRTLAPYAPKLAQVQ